MIVPRVPLFGRGGMYEKVIIRIFQRLNKTRKNYAQCVRQIIALLLINSLKPGFVPFFGKYFFLTHPPTQTGRAQTKKKLSTLRPPGRPGGKKQKIFFF